MSNDSKPQAGEFCWNELMTSDTKKAQTFYSGLFGWKAQSLDMGPMTYTMFASGEKTVGGMLQIPADRMGKVPPHWMSYVAVENLDKTVEKAKTLGANIKVSATEIPNMGRFAVIEDPQGAHLAFWQPA